MGILPGAARKAEHRNAHGYLDGARGAGNFDPRRRTASYIIVWLLTLLLFLFSLFLLLPLLAAGSARAPSPSAVSCRTG